jgi:hypothetical protein
MERIDKVQIGLNLVMITSVLMGSITGRMDNFVLPSWSILIIFPVFVFGVYLTFRNARSE